jgi:3'-phosphoadenosine 5'-phosphosulfate sulfotransferase (PAPS reductase)/FAD synthetase
MRIVNCTGIRSEESSQRSKQISWKANKSLSVAGRTVWDWMPLFHETLEEVLSWHRKSGTPLHPIYVPEFHRDGTTGGYPKRFSCDSASSQPQQIWWRLSRATPKHLNP